METFQVLWTVVAFVVFVGIAIWAFSSKRKQDFSEAANLPLTDDDPNELMGKRENNNG